MSHRTQKVSSVIKRAVSNVINSVLKEYTKVFVSVSDVIMSPDLQIAKVYISVQNEDIWNKIKPFIELEKGKIRKLVGSEVKLRFTPELRFFYDDTLDKIETIDKLLASIPKSE
jgi:ribosome-binding factor A